jgi:hypothetical protein
MDVHLPVAVRLRREIKLHTHQTPNTKHQTPNTKHQTPGKEGQATSKMVRIGLHKTQHVALTFAGFQIRERKGKGIFSLYSLRDFCCFGRAKFSHVKRQKQLREHRKVCATQQQSNLAACKRAAC